MQRQLSGENVVLWPQMAAAYQFSMDGVYSSGSWPRWARWGWCNPSEVLDIINRNYQFKWDIRELFRRFAFCAQDLVDTGKPPLGILMLREGLATFEDYHPFWQANVVDRVFVPAGWTKDIFWALCNGCTQFKVLDNPAGMKPTRALTACLEDGRGIYYV